MLGKSRVRRLMPSSVAGERRRRVLGWVLAYAGSWLVVPILLLTCLAATALDGVRLAAISKAADEFVALAKQNGNPPRQSDPEVRRLLDMVLDVSEVKQGPVLPISALNNLGAWILDVNKVGEIYALAGTGFTSFASVPPNNPEVDKKTNQNTLEFAPEMGVTSMRHCGWRGA